MNTPSIEEFKSPLPPYLLFKRLESLPYSFFLDSAVEDEKIGRFSFIGCDPFLIFKSKKDLISLQWRDGKIEKIRSNPFSTLKELFQRFSVSSLSADGASIPFLSGGVGYFGYDMKDFIEKLPDISTDDMSMPDCVIGFYDAVLIFDNIKSKSYIGSVKFECVRSGSSDRLKAAIFSGGPGGRIEYSDDKCGELIQNFDKSSYMNSVEKAKEYIESGDIYQVNLSQRFEADFSGEPYGLYLKLRESSPAPFASYLNFNDVIIISSSPERFLMKAGSYIETRPIKGTAPRSADPVADEFNEVALKTSYKDRAEHIMIVDLERNDLGRVCEYGSVKPVEFINMEKYSTVFHLVSTVSGRLKKGVGPIDCLTAAFPGGSITGAPKVRSMEVIEALEPVKRSLYTGAIGYISFDGNMDTSIVIRTIIIKNGRLYFQVGGGIVADSDPEKEYYETLDKAEGIMRALYAEDMDKRKICKSR